MADVVVIGGGIMGVSIALSLGRLGRVGRAGRADRGGGAGSTSSAPSGRVILIEKRHLGAGSSGKSGAILRQHYSHPATIRMARDSLREYATFADRTGRDIGFRRTGILFLADERHRAALEHNVALMQSLGVTTAVLDAGELRELEPRLVVSDDAVAAWEPDAGYVDPVLTLHAFAQEAREVGVEIREGDGVEELLVEPGAAGDARHEPSELADRGVTDVGGGPKTGRSIRGVRLTSGEIVEAPIVVNCGGPWAGRLLEPLGVSLPLTVLRPQQSFFEAPPDFGEPTPICCDLATGIYWKPEQASWTRAGAMAYDEDDTVEDPDVYDEGVTDAFLAACRDRLSHRLPAYDRAIDWGGCAALYTVTPDSHPVIGPVGDVRGLFVVSGWSGHGFKMGPAVGRGIAGLVTNGDAAELDLDLFAPDRFVRGLTVQGAHAYGILG